MKTLPVGRSRSKIVLGGLFVVSLICTGCSGADEESHDVADAESSDSLIPEGEGATEYPLTLGSTFGETVLENRPERISLAGVGSEIELLALLEVSPVGVSETAAGPDGIRPYAVDLLPRPVEHLWEFSYDDPAPVEAIAESDPDLIIADNTTTDELYEQLSSIAPVLYVADEGQGNANSDWRENIADIGEAIDLPAKADEVVEDDDDFWQDFSGKYPELEGKTVTLMAAWDRGTGSKILNTPGSLSEEYLARLGFADNPNLGDFAGANPVSNELIPKMDADLILGFNAGDAFDELTDNSLFQNLPAVRDGRFVEIEMDMSNGRDTLLNGESIGFHGHVGQVLNGVTGPLGERAAAEAMVPHLVDVVR